MNPISARGEYPLWQIKQNGLLMDGSVKESKDKTETSVLLGNPAVTS